MAEGATQTVRISAHTDVAFGEEVLLCGSAVSLGCWDLSKAAQMRWQDKGLWAVDVPLPCGVKVEMKPVIRPQGGVVRWIGAGSRGTENLMLEVNLGRPGAQSSRFISCEGCPFRLTAEDVATPPSAELEVPSENGYCPTPRSHAPEIPLSARSGISGISGISGASAPYQNMMGMGGPQSEVAMLAAHCGGAGRAVTYTTTTTTTTAVTINSPPPGYGAQMPGMAPQMQAIAPEAYGGYGGGGGGGGGGYGYPPQYPSLPGVPEAPHSPSDSQRCQDSPPHGDPCGPTEEEIKALAAAKEVNAGIPTAGPAPLAWRGSAKEVRARGSWDGWQRDLALEPVPGGGGFRLMLVLPPGEYEMKFIVDGTWTTSDDMERTKCENKNNLLRVSEMVLIPVPLTNKLMALADQSEQSLALAVSR